MIRSAPTRDAAATTVASVSGFDSRMFDATSPAKRKMSCCT
jgi:hypothetical protein